MANQNIDNFRLVVFVPQREFKHQMVLPCILDYAYMSPLPVVCPIAIVDEPLDDNELKLSAQKLSHLILDQSQDQKRKISATEYAVQKFGSKFLLLGSVLSFSPVDLLDNMSSKYIFKKALVCSHIGLSDKTVNENNIMQEKTLNFYSGALANMVLRITYDDKAIECAQWKIGKLHWMPSVKSCGNKK
ncbi:MAG: hypothetical protein Ta2F_08830 [Termitinemataceae bacterium]|nr:MAG: hypothetical protein Ta2F_08830 [Termitinemataceae bacterium]